MKTLWHVITMAALLGAVGIAQEAPKRVSKAEALSAIASKVQPDYPPIARQLKIEGKVDVDVTVTETGEVAKVDIVSGNPVLTAPTVQVVKRWKFKPFLEDGKPIRVVAPVTLDFKL